MTRNVKLFVLYKYFSGEAGANETTSDTSPPPVQQPTVIPGVDSLIGDLLDMDIGGPTPYQQQQMMSQLPTSAPPPAAAVDLLGEGLDNLVSVQSFVLLSVCLFFFCQKVMDL